MPKSEEEKPKFHYDGFESPNYTPIPNDVFDLLAPELTEAELRILMYVARRTFGFGKSSDAISTAQMTNGIMTKDGRVLDRGTGMSRSAVWRGVKGLVEKGILEVESVRSELGDSDANIYSLRFHEGVTLQKSNGSPRKEQPVTLQKSTQKIESQEKVKQEIYPSKIRKAENEKTDYVNQLPEANREVGAPSTTEETEQPKQGRPTKTTNAGNEENQRLSKNRKVEEPQRVTANPPDREIPHKLQTGNTATPGLMRLGDVLHQQHIPQAVPDDEAYEAIRDYIRDMAGKHHDEASLNSSTTRAYNLYLKSGVSLTYFINVFYDADKEAGRRSGSITKRTADGFTNRMPYIFAYMEDKLGLRPKGEDH